MFVWLKVIGIDLNSVGKQLWPAKNFVVTVIKLEIYKQSEIGIASFYGHMEKTH